MGQVRGVYFGGGAQGSWGWVDRCGWMRLLAYKQLQGSCCALQANHALSGGGSPESGSACSGSMCQTAGR